MAMKITIAIDSLKGSLSSLEAGRAAGEGIKRVFPDAEVEIFPIADGGEGTVDALVAGLKGRKRLAEVQDPLGRAVKAAYGILQEKNMAVIEIAAAAGITFLDSEERNPLKTTTFGVGQLIRDAIRQGCRNFLIGLGGSATNDGGVGMLQALGYEFQKKDGTPIDRGAQGLEELAHISAEHAMPELSQCTFQIACDVANPLCGEMGCSTVFGPQKGADRDMIRKMDQWLLSYAQLTGRIYPKADKNYPGAGAAGGLGFAFLTYLNASLRPGISIVLEALGIENEIQRSDFVITGEGRLDGQTVMGKAPIGVAKLAKKYKKPVIAFSGSVGREAYLCNEAGIDAFFPILKGIVTKEEAMEKGNAAANMADTAEQVFRFVKTLQYK